MATMKRIIQAALVLGGWSFGAARHRGDWPRPNTHGQGAILPDGYPRSLRSETPTTERAKVKTHLRLKLLPMSSTMDDQAVDVFERTCSGFLGHLMSRRTPPVIDIVCKVSPQQEHRALSASRRLEGSTANAHAQDHTERTLNYQFLFVDVRVRGTRVGGDSDSKSDYLTFDDLVQQTFAVDQATFVDQLKATGEFEGLEVFSDLHTVLAVSLAGEGKGMAQGSSAPTMTHENAHVPKIMPAAVIVAIVGGSIIIFLISIWLMVLCNLFFSSKSAVTKEEVSDAKEMTRTDKMVLALGGHYA
ncbi:hypothetical protein ACHAWF_003951 [Thalassiosira exigua]